MKTNFAILFSLCLSVALSGPVHAAKTPAQLAEKAIKSGDAKTLRNLLSTRAVSANDKTPDGVPYIIAAVRRGYTFHPDTDDGAPEVVAALLENGADANVTYPLSNGLPGTAIMHAIRYNRNESLKAIVASGKADLNYTFCYQHRKGKSFGRILDVAYHQLHQEMSLAGVSGTPNEFQDVGMVGRVQDMIRTLKAAGAVQGEPNMSQCQPANLSAN